MYEVFEALLKQFGVSTADVCKATGIRPNTISNWKKKRHILSSQFLEKIAQYFDVSVDYLLTGATNEHTSVEGQEYYFSDDAAHIAQEIYENKDLRALFDVAQDIAAEDLRKFAAMLKVFKDGDKP